MTLDNCFIVYVYDTFGALIYKEENIKEKTLDINISNRSHGLYFVKIINGDQTFNRKVVFQ